MKTWIALLRGVNVGGKNGLPMKQLAAELEAAGLSDVRTYLQSGNVVFSGPSGRATDLAAEIGGTIRRRFGFGPHVVVIDAEYLAASAIANPFPEAATEADGRALHLFFLSEPPAADEGRLEAIRRPSERWQIRGAVFYLHSPEGFADSKLASRVETILGVPATARNWRTIRALLDLADHSLP